MNNWKISLDRYLTTPPDDGFDGWYEMVIDTFSEKFYNTNESWIHECGGIFDKWLNKLHRKGKDHIEASTIIERAFHLYVQ
jgi:hypothetical protein